MCRYNLSACHQHHFVHSYVFGQKKSSETQVAHKGVHSFSECFSRRRHRCHCRHVYIPPQNKTLVFQNRHALNSIALDMPYCNSVALFRLKLYIFLIFLIFLFNNALDMSSEKFLFFLGKVLNVYRLTKLNNRMRLLNPRQMFLKTFISATV